jgi:hypothetical protein
MNASIRIELIRERTLQAGGLICGEAVQARIIKNRFFHRVSSANIIIVYNRGINKCNELLHYGKITNTIRKHRSRFWYGEQCLGHNQLEVMAQLQSDPALAREIESDIRSLIFSEMPIPGT